MHVGAVQLENSGAYSKLLLGYHRKKADDTKFIIVKCPENVFKLYLIVTFGKVLYKLRPIWRCFGYELLSNCMQKGIKNRGLQGNFLYISRAALDESDKQIIRIPASEM